MVSIRCWSVTAYIKGLIEVLVVDSFAAFENAHHPMKVLIVKRTGKKTIAGKLNSHATRLLGKI
tara:strand:+ start:42 stop:233 length:192 start_codon:yes stop_codon:yes gene_type:complete